jgi:GTP-dependent phosphoenolpyruvate carboxykinase
MFSFTNSNSLKFKHLANYTQANGLSSSLSDLPKSVRDYVLEKAKICQPDNIKICDGSETEYKSLLSQLEKEGVIKPLLKFKNRYLVNIFFKMNTT